MTVLGSVFRLGDDEWSWTDYLDCGRHRVRVQVTIFRSTVPERNMCSAVQIDASGHTICSLDGDLCNLAIERALIAAVNEER